MKYSVQLRDKNKVLHSVRRVPDNFTFDDKETAIKEAGILCTIYIASDYVVVEHDTTKDRIIWERQVEQ